MVLFNYDAFLKHVVLFLRKNRRFQRKEIHILQNLAKLHLSLNSSMITFLILEVLMDVSTMPSNYLNSSPMFFNQL